MPDISIIFPFCFIEKTTFGQYKKNETSWYFIILKTPVSCLHTNSMRGTTNKSHDVSVLKNLR